MLGTLGLASIAGFLLLCTNGYAHGIPNRSLNTGAAYAADDAGVEKNVYPILLKSTNDDDQ